MRFEAMVALRFLREGRAQTAFILAGASVGVAVLVFLSALISGLQTSLIKQTLGSQAHVVVRPNDEEPRLLTDVVGAAATLVEKGAQRPRTIRGWEQVVAQLRQIPGVLEVAPSVAGSAFASRGLSTRSVALRGVTPESYDRVIDVSSKIVAGRFRFTGTDAVLGVELAQELNVGVGDKLRLVTTEGRSDVFRVAGLFDLGNKDVNLRWVFVSMRAAQSLLDMPGAASTIELKVTDIFAAQATALEAAGRTGLVADAWTQLNRQLMVGLRSQDSSKDMIEFFVVIAVALGITSVLVVSVVQKSREIGILRAIGVSRGQVQRIFLLQGLVVGVVGSLLGGLGGAALATFFATLAKGPDGSPLFPVDLSPQLFLGASVVALSTGLLAALLPARRAARLDPAAVIRNG